MAAAQIGQCFSTNTEPVALTGHLRHIAFFRPDLREFPELPLQRRGRRNPGTVIRLLDGAPRFENAPDAGGAEGVAHRANQRHRQLRIRIRKEAIGLGRQLPVFRGTAKRNRPFFGGDQLLALQGVEMLPHRHRREAQLAGEPRRVECAFRFQEFDDRAAGLAFVRGAGGSGDRSHFVFIKLRLYKVNGQRIHSDLVNYFLSKVGDMRMTSINGLRVAVTGGTSGLGLALVRELSARGGRVALVARGSERVARVAAQCPGAHPIVGDVSRKADIYPIALQMLGELDGLDVLINNASDLGPESLRLLGDTDCEDLERALATNLLGPFRLTKAVLGALAASAREQRGGIVVNVSSDAAITPYASWGAYGTSKAALRHMSAIWAVELESPGRTCALARSG